MRLDCVNQTVWLEDAHLSCLQCPQGRVGRRNTFVLSKNCPKSSQSFKDISRLKAHLRSIREGDENHRQQPALIIARFLNRTAFRCIVVLAVSTSPTGVYMCQVTQCFFAGL